MPSEWRLQEAKNNLSRLIKEAASGEAQFVSVQGKPAAVVVSVEAYARLTRLGPGHAIYRTAATRSRKRWPGLCPQPGHRPERLAVMRGHRLLVPLGNRPGCWLQWQPAGAAGRLPTRV
jgi:prevent-host-death family protein